MRKRSDSPEKAEALRDRIIGLGERSFRKSYYPQLRDRIGALEKSEKQFRAVFEGAAVGIAVAGLDYRIEQANDELQKMMGRDAADLRETSLLDLVHDQYRSSLASRFEYLLRQDFSNLSAGSIKYTSLESNSFALGDPLSEVWLAASNGCIPASVQISLVMGAQKKPAYYVVAIQDLSSLKRFQDALQFLSQASIRLSSSLDLERTCCSVCELACPFLGDVGAVYLLGETDGCRLRSMALSAHLSRPSVEKFFEAGAWADWVGSVISQTCDQPVPRLFSELPESLRAALANVSASGANHAPIMPQSVIIVPMVARDRLIGTLLVVTTDKRKSSAIDFELTIELGRRAALAIENARLFQGAQEANRLKDEFLAIISHELRTPLTSILGWLSLAKPTPEGASLTARATEVIKRNARMLAHIIDDLLDVSRIISGKLDTHFEPVNFASLIESATEGFRPEIQEKKITLAVEIDHHLPFVLGDPKRMQQIFWNLMSNAIKFTAQQGKIQVRVEGDGENVVLSVRDNGRGITRDLLPHIFERFRQADSSVVRSQGGLGLGLTIVRHLVELHHGTVNAYSAGAGQGSCFFVRMPFMKRDVFARSEPGVARISSSSLQNVNVLLVEDDHDVLDILEETLREQGATVQTALNVQQALARIERRVPDVVVSDIAMPERDGFSFLEEVRERGWNFPAIALTALARTEDRQRAMQVGFERYLLKPIDMTEVIRTVHDAVSQRQQAMENVRADGGD